jgi:hypothetical protein
MLVLVGRLENVVSDRRLVGHCALRLDSRYFLGYDVVSLKKVCLIVPEYPPGLLRRVLASS